ncbi:hypothetical protein BaRGS_00004275 [Batillaria attramentaria]|uniref:Uncharacterized protein n=1 Tax=Batillaria attramentaria TaxID=370345 RepID=A0ABD0LXL1_9CAEN
MCDCSVYQHARCSGRGQILIDRSLLAEVQMAGKQPHWEFLTHHSEGSTDHRTTAAGIPSSTTTVVRDKKG